MRCKQCDYPLWNLKARQCPECGYAFVPADFEFIVNSVRFCCPHCDQSYYGTGAKGHLVPLEFNCVNCTRRIAMNDMVLRPAEGVEERQTQAGYMPWLMRQQLGWWKGWIRTIGYAMVKPHLLMRAIPHEAGIGQAWWFATASCFIFFSCGVGVALAIVGLLMLSNGNSDAVNWFIAAPIAVLGMTASYLVFALIWGLVAHGLLRMTGDAAHSIGRTYSAILYSMAAIAPTAIPFAGPYCGTWVLWIWWCVSAIVMVVEGQKVHGGRASFAVLTFPIVMVLLFVGGYAALVYTAMSAFSRIQTQAAAFNTAVSDTNLVSLALVQHAQANNGKWPRHALELMSDQTFGALNFVGTETDTDVPDVMVGDSTLEDIEKLPDNRRKMAIRAAGDALPSDVIAHRLGDFVFTYHGIDFNNANPGLWIMIYSPDPDSDTSSDRTLVVVARVNGTAIRLPGRLQDHLPAQNALRAKAGLAPLPDPANVTHDAPAAASDPIPPAPSNDAAPDDESDS